MTEDQKKLEATYEMLRGAFRTDGGEILEERRGDHAFFTLTIETLNQLKECVDIDDALPFFTECAFVIRSEKYLPLIIRGNRLSIRGQFTIEHSEIHRYLEY
jgi:hypothetical protein